MNNAKIDTIYQGNWYLDYIQNEPYIVINAEGDIFVPIIKLSENKKEESDAVVNAVELGVAVEDLEAQLDMTSSMIERLDGVQSKPELLALLSSIRQGVTQMGGISDAYDQSIIEQYQGITPKILQKERAAYKSDRSWDE